MLVTSVVRNRLPPGAARTAPASPRPRPGNAQDHPKDGGWRPVFQNEKLGLVHEVEGVTKRSVRVPLWAGDVLEVWTTEARVTRGSHGKNGKGPLFRPRPFYLHRQGGVSDQDEETERSRRVGHMSEPRGVSGPTDPWQKCPILESHTGPQKCQTARSEGTLSAAFHKDGTTT